MTARRIGNYPLPSRQQRHWNQQPSKPFPPSASATTRFPKIIPVPTEMTQMAAAAVVASAARNSKGISIPASYAENHPSAQRSSNNSNSNNANPHFPFHRRRRHCCHRQSRIFPTATSLPKKLCPLKTTTNQGCTQS